MTNRETGLAGVASPFLAPGTMRAARVPRGAARTSAGSRATGGIAALDARARAT